MTIISRLTLVLSLFYAISNAGSNRYEFLNHFLKFSSDTAYEKEHTYDTLICIYFNDFDMPLDTVMHYDKSKFKGIPWSYINGTVNMNIEYDSFSKKSVVKYYGSGGLLMYMRFKYISNKWYLIEYEDTST